MFPRQIAKINHKIKNKMVTLLYKFTFIYLFIKKQKLFMVLLYFNYPGARSHFSLMAAEMNFTS